MGDRERGGWRKFLYDVLELVSPPEIKTPGALREKVSFFYDRVKDQLEFIGDEFCNQSTINIEGCTHADLSVNFGAIEGCVNEYIQGEYRMYKAVEQGWEQFQLDYRHRDCKIKDIPVLLEAFMRKLERAEQHGN